MAELLPCPFCGGNADKIQTAGMWKIECWNMEEGCGVETAFFNKEEDAIAAWNTRAKVGA